MKKYLKMEDYFDTGDILADGSILHDASGVVAKVSGPSAYASYVAHAINSHDELVAMNKELLAALEKVVSDITALSESSYGVHGLHRNGDLAPWSTLFSGGFFEDWLLSVDEAGALIEKAKGTA